MIFLYLEIFVKYFSKCFFKVHLKFKFLEFKLNKEILEIIDKEITPFAKCLSKNRV